MSADREVSLHSLPFDRTVANRIRKFIFRRMLGNVERMPSNPAPDAHTLGAAFYFARGVLLEHNIRQPAVTLAAFSVAASTSQSARRV